jgi:hypothetical protein
VCRWFRRSLMCGILSLIAAECERCFSAGNRSDDTDIITAIAAEPNGSEQLVIEAQVTRCILMAVLFALATCIPTKVCASGDFGGRAVQKNSRKVPARNLIALEIETEHDKVAIDGDLTILVRIKNTSRNSIRIYRPPDWREFGGVSFWFRSESTNHDVALAFIPGPIPPIEPKKREMVRLAPGERIAFSVPLAMTDHSIPSAGEYRLHMTYRSPLSNAAVTFGADVLTREKGEFVSNEVVLLVTKQGDRGQ